MDATHPIWQLPQVSQASGQRDSKLPESGTALPGLEFRLTFLAGSPVRWEGSILTPPLLPPSPSCPRMESVLDCSSLRVRESSPGITPSAWGALLVLLFFIHQEKISAGILFCWNQSISQNPADFNKIFLKKIRKTKSSISAITILSMFEMQHSCLFYFKITFILLLCPYCNR